MTENKRFRCDGAKIFDGDEFLCCTLSIWTEQLVDLLNELNEENTQLKNKSKFFNELNKPYGAIIEENIRLKAFIKQLTNNSGEIILMNGVGYNVDKILGDYE